MSNFLQPHESHSMPGLPVRHQLPESTQTHVHPVDDAIQPSHPLSSPSPPWRAAGKESESCSWCLTLCDPMDDIVHGILQAKTLEWVAFPFSSTSAQPRNQTRVSCIAGGFSCFAAGKEADFALYQVLSTLAFDILGNTFLWGLSYAL